MELQKNYAMKNCNCLFCNIVNGEHPSWIIWEDPHHIAFLTPYPNTPGFTVVATKQHLDSNIFNLPNHELHSLIDAAGMVSKLLNTTLDVKRSALIAEGMGINHAHIKLVPLYGIPEGDWEPINSTMDITFTTYPGYVSSHDGPRAENSELDRIANLIRAKQKR
jgi:histidine triad (HIT) family protein